MIRRKHGKSKEAPELNITAFLNLMVVLVPFLLVSAVFSRITILELNMPAGAGGPSGDPPKITIEVVIREDVIEISDGGKVVVRFAKIDNPDPKTRNEDPTIYDRVKLTNYLLKLKAGYPDTTDSTILMEPNIEYRHLVSLMDTVRNAEIPRATTNTAVDEAPEFEKIELFPDISIGDAP
ncbi:MAG: biopolymer transporter ExbD [Gammaproteobacteria bacterium]|nr:biopolymer transporter ExbD [Gammaproteobacteria bacterium]